MKKAILLLIFLLTHAWAASSIEENIDTVLADYGLLNINANFDLGEIKQQQMLAKNKVQFIKALRMALASFIQDDEDIESPKAILIEFAFQQLQVPFDFPYPNQVEKRSEVLVKQFMLDPSSQLELQELHTAAENGETTEDFWIFRLYMGSLSDHQYWAIVDRQGKIKTYNYGFN